MNMPNIGSDLTAASSSSVDQEPQGAKNFLYLAAQAQQAKKSGDFLQWQNAIKELELESKKESFEKDKKHWTETQGNLTKIRELTEKGMSTDTANKTEDFQRSLAKQAVEYLKNGQTEQGYKMLIAAGRNSSEIDGLLKIAAKEAVKDPRFLELTNLSNAGLPQEQLELAAYEHIVRGVRKTQQAAGIVSPKGQMPKATEPDASMLPAPVGPSLTPNHQKELNQFLGNRPVHERTPASPVQIPESKPIAGEMASTAPIAEGDAWTPDDHLNWNLYKGRAVSKKDTTPKVQEFEALVKGGMPREEAAAIVWDTKGAVPKAQELEALIEQGLPPREAAEMVWGTKDDKGMTDAQYSKYVFDEISNSERSQEAKDQLLSYFFGNRDRSTGASTRASDPDEAEMNVPSDWREAYDVIKTKDATAFGKSGNTTLAMTLKRINDNTELSEQKKEVQSLTALKAAVDRDAAATERQAIDGLMNLGGLIGTMTDFLQEHPSGMDPNAPGFWQDSVRKMFRNFGLTLQSDLSTMSTIIDSELALFIKSISGAAVSDHERKFLSQILVKTNDGHALNRATIDGLRHMIGTRLYVYYRDRLGENAGMKMTERMIGGRLTNGTFTESGQFRSRDEPYKSTKQESGQLPEIKGMEGGTTPVPKMNKDAQEFMDATPTVQRQTIMNVIRKAGSEREARRILIELGIPERLIGKYLSGGKK